MTYGIPEMKLPYSVVKRRVDILEEEGIEFVTNTEVGKDYTVENLRENFDAVILAGSSRPP